MSLTAIYAELHRRAKDSGEARGQTLTGGARITVRVFQEARDERREASGPVEPSSPQSLASRPWVTTLTIARKGKLVGETELSTFRAQCGVPDTAERRPKTGQNRMEHDGSLWYYLSFRWKESL